MSVGKPRHHSHRPWALLLRLLSWRLQHLSRCIAEFLKANAKTTGAIVLAMGPGMPLLPAALSAPVHLAADETQGWPLRVGVILALQVGACLLIAVQRPAIWPQHMQRLLLSAPLHAAILKAVDRIIVICALHVYWPLFFLAPAMLLGTGHWQAGGELTALALCIACSSLASARAAWAGKRQLVALCLLAGYLPCTGLGLWGSFIGTVLTATIYARLPVSMPRDTAPKTSSQQDLGLTKLSCQALWQLDRSALLVRLVTVVGLITLGAALLFHADPVTALAAGLGAAVLILLPLGQLVHLALKQREHHARWLYSLPVSHGTWLRQDRRQALTLALGLAAPLFLIILSRGLLSWMPFAIAVGSYALLLAPWVCRMQHRHPVEATIICLISCGIWMRCVFQLERLFT